jgi:brefeldin A-inhibited guanine nucleotide-exchange protein
VDDQEEWESLGEIQEVEDFPQKTSRESGKELKIADLCLRGFSGSIRVASLFKMETERDAFVSSMAKLTGLVHVGELKPKNVKAIKTLVGGSIILGEYLEGSWIEVLKVVSAVERLQLAWNSTGSGEREPRASSAVADMGYSSSSLRRSSTLLRGDDLAKELGSASPGLVKIMSELSSQSMDIAIDKVFSRTVGLSSNAIIHFFRSLCVASLEEVGLEYMGGSGVVGSGATSPVRESFEAKSPMSPGHIGISAMSGPPRMYCVFG